MKWRVLVIHIYFLAVYLNGPARVAASMELVAGARSAEGQGLPIAHVIHEEPPVIEPVALSPPDDGHMPSRLQYLVAMDGSLMEIFRHDDGDDSKSSSPRAQSLSDDLDRIDDVESLDDIVALYRFANAIVPAAIFVIDGDGDGAGDEGGDGGGPVALAVPAVMPVPRRCFSQWVRAIIRPQIYQIQTTLHVLVNFFALYTQYRFWVLCIRNDSPYFNLFNGFASSLLSVILSYFNRRDAEHSFFVKLYRGFAAFVICTFGGFLPFYTLSASVSLGRNSTEGPNKAASHNGNTLNFSLATVICLVTSFIFWLLWRVLPNVFYPLPYVQSLAVYAITYNLLPNSFIMVGIQWLALALFLGCLVLVAMNAYA